jgi:hypothetical protein
MMDNHPYIYYFLHVKINKITVVTIVTEETNNIHGSLSVILLSRLFIKKNIDVNEHERRFTFTMYIIVVLVWLVISV